MKVVIIDYGAGNCQSVKYVLEKMSVNAEITSDINTIRTADKVVFPGVGQAKTAMEALKLKGIDELIKSLKQPVLGICLGMQLLCRYSEEGGVKGLGIFNVNVKKFKGSVKIPHMGWNDLTVIPKSIFKGISQKECVYFVHSYYAECCDETIATCEYGGLFSAALQKNNFYGCQFHPEKSGDLGTKILKNFIEL